MFLTTQMNLSEGELVLLSDACQWAIAYYRDVMRPRLEDRELEVLWDLGYNPAEGEEEGEFLNALESIPFNIREFDLLDRRLNEEILKLQTTE